MNARLARERLGLTQQSAAERIGCAVPVLQRLERAASAFTVDFVARVASSYKIDIADLFAATGPWRAPKPGRPVGTVAKTPRRRR